MGSLNVSQDFLNTLLAGKDGATVQAIVAGILADTTDYSRVGHTEVGAQPGETYGANGAVMRKQFRTTGGQFGRNFSTHLQRDLELVLRHLFLDHYRALPIKTLSTGTLARAIAEGEVTVTEDGLVQFRFAKLDRERQAGRKVQTVSTRVYGPIVVAGRPGILSETRMVYQVAPGRKGVRSGHFVGPAAPKAIFTFDEGDKREVNQVILKPLTALVKQQLTDSLTAP